MTPIKKIFRAGFALGLAAVLLVGQARGSGLAQDPARLIIMVDSARARQSALPWRFYGQERRVLSKNIIRTFS
jgi:hypothetical protein